MLIQKDLLNKLIELANDSAEYLNEKWITVKPHGADSKGTHILVKDGETSKEAIDRKFDTKAKEKKDINNYLKNKKPIEQGKIKISLNKEISHNNDFKTKKQFVEDVISKEKATPKIKLLKKTYNGEAKEHYILETKEGKNYFISKTEFDYAEYLST